MGDALRPAVAVPATDQGPARAHVSREGGDEKILTFVSSQSHDRGLPCCAGSGRVVLLPCCFVQSPYEAADPVMGRRPKGGDR
jgi:hypothetical protein